MKDIENYQIMAIFRINNPWLTKTFAERKGPSDNIKWGWHGTDIGKHLSISKNSYYTPENEEYQMSTDSWFGKGTYFAPEAYKSLLYSDEIRDICLGKKTSKKTGWLVLNKIDIGSKERVWEVPPREQLEEEDIPEEFDSVYAYGDKGTEINMDEIVIRDIERVLPTHLVKVGCIGR